MKRTPNLVKAHRASSLALGLTALAFAHLMGGIAPAAAAPRPEAEVLFQEGTALLDAGKPAEACPKLEESQRLDPAPGTQFYLAECYAALGRTASAWLLFSDVADRSRASHKLTEERKARARAEALAPRLSRLTIVVPEPTASLRGLEISRDGVTVGKAAWGTPIPVDPGPHVIRATADGRAPWEATREVEGPRAMITITVAPLEAQAEAPSKPSAEAPRPGGEGPRAGSAGQRLAAGVIGGVGLASLAAGSALGALSLSRNGAWQDETAKAGCINGRNCAAASIPEIRSIEAERDRFALLSTVGVIAGSALSVGAVILWATAPPSPRAKEAKVRLLPAVDRGGLGVRLDGSF